MTKILASLLVAFFMPSGIVAQQLIEVDNLTVTIVTWSQLQAKPDFYDGQRVALQGFCSVHDDKPWIFASEDHRPDPDRAVPPLSSLLVRGEPFLADCMGLKWAIGRFFALDLFLGRIDLETHLRDDLSGGPR